ncbi:hypothetical protein B0H14DRAFT_3540566 [Mycena olivaceomarginata]|nr:hypothetical protein B0H14DRAFT_3540566 [Mycena olivaceomarginata]
MSRPRALHASLLSATAVCADPAPSTPTPTFASAACTSRSVASSPHQRPAPSLSPASTSTHPRLRAPVVPPPDSLYCEEACLGSVSEPRALVVARCMGIADDGCAAQRREDEETHD